MLEKNNANLCVMDEVPGEISLSEALNRPEKKQWQNAFSEELRSFADRDALKLVDRPLNKIVVKC